jgi:hypothetical protein
MAETDGLRRKWRAGDKESRKNAMKERKKNTVEKLKRRDQVALTRLRTDYSRATHRNKMEGTPDPDYPFCSAKLKLEHILWQCKETEKERQKSNMTEKI